MESKLFKMFVSLGVPGLALGVFYMLFKKFDWNFTNVPPEWVGPIIILFMILTTGIIFYTLSLWKPRSAPAYSVADGNQVTKNGATALNTVLEDLEEFLKRKYEQEDNGENKILKEKIYEAKEHVEETANHTRHYIADLKVGKRDRKIEGKLSDEWTKVGRYLRDINSPEAQQLYEICFLKARYWSDTDGWDDSYSNKDISLNRVLNLVKEIACSKQKTG